MIKQRSVCLLAAVLGCAGATALDVRPSDAGTLTTIYDFTSGAAGADPVGGVIEDSKGTLYGETYLAGAPTCTSKSLQSSLGCGTVYSYSALAGLKTLVSFTGPNGAHGASGLTLVGSTLYGSTAFGGSSDDGVLFSVHTDGTGFTLLHQFSGIDGREPTGFLRMGPGGFLYGITEQGGPTYPQNNYGVLFSIAPDGTYTVLHNFTNGPDGSLPNALLISGSTLIGSTTFAGSGISQYCPQGCGVVFEFATKTGKFSVLHDFSGLDGAFPYVGSFGPGSTIYGASNVGVFSINPSGYSDVGTFGMNDGYDPVSGPLYVPGGILVGVTTTGPQSASGQGSIYTIQKGILTTPYIFGGGESGGYNPAAQPILSSSRSIIGTSTVGDFCAGCGAIWKYTP